MAFASLLSGASPDALRASSPRAAPSFSIDNVLTHLDGIEAKQGPMAGEFARSFIEGQFRRRGVPLDIKSRGERELEQRQSALAAMQLKDLERSRVVRETVGFLMDNAEQSLEQALGIPGDSRSLQDVLGTRLDASILQRPNDLLRASGQIARFLGDESFALKHSDLLTNEFTSPFARQSPEDLGAAKAGRQSKAQRDLVSNVEFQQELQAGEGVAAESLNQRLEATGESVGQDLSPGFLGDDFDEARGSAAAVASILQTGQEFQSQGLDREVLLGILLSESVGKRIGSVLSAGETQIAEDGSRILRIDGGAFNDPEAVSNYVALIDKVSELTGRPRKEILQLMGLPFDDFAEEEIGQARANLGLK